MELTITSVCQQASHMQSNFSALLCLLLASFPDSFACLHRYSTKHGGEALDILSHNRQGGGLSQEDTFSACNLCIEQQAV